LAVFPRGVMRQLLEAVSDYCKQFFVATLGSMLGAVGLVLLCALITGLLHINVSVAAYQKLLLSHPFPLQIFTGLGLGFALSHRMKGNRFAVWLWILPALGLAFDFVTWHPTSVVTTGSAAEHFFTSEWVLLPPSPQRMQIVVDQFSRTVALCTSLAYGVGSSLHAVLSRKRHLVSDP